MPVQALDAEIRFAALGRVHGEFLAGFSLPDSPGFDDWVAIQRESCQRQVEAIYDRLTQHLLAAKSKDTPHELVVGWVSTVSERVAHLQRIISEMRSAGAMDFPTLSVALQEVRKLAQNG